MECDVYSLKLDLQGDRRQFVNLTGFCSRSDRQHRGKGKGSRGRAQPEGKPKYMLVMRNLNKKQYRRMEFLPCLSLLALHLPCPAPALACPAFTPALLISSPGDCPEHWF